MEGLGQEAWPAQVVVPGGTAKRNRMTGRMKAELTGFRKMLVTTL